jgi:hypothetical protein
LPPVRIERMEYAGWPNCYCLTNGEVELIATSDVGPRIMRCGFTGGQNFFAEFAEQLGKSGESQWMPRGGHRLWIAPEIRPETYALDNAPVEVSTNGNTLILRQPIEPETSLQKKISVELTAEGRVTVTHRIANTGSKPMRFGPWVLSMMAPGGLAIAAFPPRAGHDETLLPTNPLVMWAYTDFTDTRWKFQKRYLLLKQDPSNIYPQKAGLFNENTVCAYLLGTELFIKRTTAKRNTLYPDFGTSAQFFVNGEFLELETLGPLGELLPGSSVTHVERWSLHKDITLQSTDDDDEIDRVLLPLLGQF